MIKKIKNAIFHSLYNRVGFRTNKKIIVFESDDWGSIRMPSLKVYNNLLNKGLRVDCCHYCRFDSLAVKEDMEMLFDLLLSYTDSRGSNPVITANTIVANPDFDKIKASDFQHYFYKGLQETLNEYPDCSFDLWKKGIAQNIFHPQFHGREHLNVSRWMHALQSKSKEAHLAFENRLFGISQTISNEKRPSFLAALDADCRQDLMGQKQILEEGLDLFKKIFNYESDSFIAPNYIWHSSIEDILMNKNIKFIQGAFFQNEPNLKGSLTKKIHFCGQKNKNKQLFLTRNCFFEPSSLSTKDWVASCLTDINNAFAVQKPAVISVHRVNFIGSIDKRNRDNTLFGMHALIQGIMKHWPDVEFLTSDALGEFILASCDHEN